MVVKNVKDSQPQIPSHQHSVIYDYENGEKICNLCGIVVQDKLYDTELDIDFYNYKSDTNTGYPWSITLNVHGMSTAIADYNTKSSKRFSSRKQHNKIEFLSKIVSCSNKNRNSENSLKSVKQAKRQVVIDLSMYRGRTFVLQKGS